MRVNLPNLRLRRCRPHRTVRRVLAVATTLVVLPWSVPAGAQQSRLAVTDPSSTVLPELNVVPVRTTGLTAVLKDLDAAQALVDGAQAAAHAAVAEQGRLVLALRDIQTDIATLTAARETASQARYHALEAAEQAGVRQRLAQADVDAVQNVLDELAAQAFIVGGQGVSLLGDSETGPAAKGAGYLGGVFAEQGRRRDLAGREVKRAQAARSEDLAEAATQEQERRSLDRQLTERAAAARRNNLETLAQAEAQRAALAEVARLQEPLRAARLKLAEARRTMTVVGADFPLVILDAFVRAVRYEAEHRPACRLDWQLLAAISRLESGHGTSGGVRVDAVGQVPNILGPPLVPGSPFAVVPDSDGGMLDGDASYDRAVGPMQFIPSSWQIFGLDGDGDGDRDPRNYYDAALAAAEHLCRAGADTGTDEGRRAAVYGYNHSDEYVNGVLAARQSYLALRW